MKNDAQTLMVTRILEALNEYGLSFDDEIFRVTCTIGLHENDDYSENDGMVEYSYDGEKFTNIRKSRSDKLKILCDVII